MRRPCVALQLLDHRVAERTFRQHAFDGLLERAAGKPGLHLAERRRPDAAGIAAVTMVELVVRLVAGDADLVDVRDDDEIARVHVVFALVAQFLLIGYSRFRARALSPAITEARLQALQARIRPHFLFNSLTAVLSLMRSEPRRAEAALEDLADLFRVLMRDNRDLAPLADEVELCRQYLELEQLRLGDRLEIDWNVKSMPGDALVPPFVLQPLLENAVYHGIEPLTERGLLSINIFLSRDEVHAILKNPYVATGARHQVGNNMALDNIRERLALHFDAEASLESRITRDSWEVHIRMPYRTQKPTASGKTATKSERPDRGNDRGTHKRRQQQGRPLPAKTATRIEPCRLRQRRAAAARASRTGRRDQALRESSRACHRDARRDDRPQPSGGAGRDCQAR